MFYSLTGKIVYSDQQCVAIECGGVAFKCTVSFNTLKQLDLKGGSAKLFTHLAVREDAMELFGFADEQELDFFKLLIGVSGVGPKVAIAVLSAFAPSSLALCIASGDVKSLSKAQGVGAKTAQRIVLELKDKVTKIAPSKITSSEFSSGVPSFGTGNISEAISALAALGFAQSEAARVLSGLDGTLSVEELVKQGLKLLSRGI